MNLETIQKIITLSSNRIPFLIKEGEGNFYHGSETYINGILDEIEEVQEELKEDNYIYLEDELGDIFWDYVCFLESLEQEWKINKARVFERCYAKFSGRLNLDGSNNGDWNSVKKIQKEELKKEHDAVFWIQ